MRQHLRPLHAPIQPLRRASQAEENLEHIEAPEQHVDDHEGEGDEIGDVGGVVRCVAGFPDEAGSVKEWGEGWKEYQSYRGSEMGERRGGRRGGTRGKGEHTDHTNTANPPQYLLLISRELIVPC